MFNLNYIWHYYIEKLWFIVTVAVLRMKCLQSVVLLLLWMSFYSIFELQFLLTHSDRQNSFFAFQKLLFLSHLTPISHIFNKLLIFLVHWLDHDFMHIYDTFYLNWYNNMHEYFELGWKIGSIKGVLNNIYARTESLMVPALCESFSFSSHTAWIWRFLCHR